MDVVHRFVGINVVGAERAQLVEEDAVGDDEDGGFGREEHFPGEQRYGEQQLDEEDWSLSAVNIEERGETHTGTWPFCAGETRPSS